MGPRTVMGAYTRDQGDPTKERPTLKGQAQEWMAPNVPNGGRSTKHAEQVGNTMYHNGKKVQMGLESQAKEWRAPQAGDSNRGPKSQRGASYGYRDQAGMHSLVSQANHWAGPAAQNHKGSSEGSITRQDGKSRADILSYQAEQFFRPPSSPDQPIIAGGSTSSTAGPNSNQPSAKRKLNPIFVEGLMRWPTGLSGFARQETAWTRWWLLMPGFVSTLFSAIPEQKQHELF